MASILSAVVSLFAFRFRSRASLEIELIAVRHQLAVLRRQRPGRPQLSLLDRLLWVWLYRIWPQVIDAMVLVKPTTVMQWHRKGFRLHWRWRSRRPGRPKIGTEIRALIRRMSNANPLWGRAAHSRGVAQARHRLRRSVALPVAGYNYNSVCCR
jgi:putative transposase